MCLARTKNQYKFGLNRFSLVKPECKYPLIIVFPFNIFLRRTSIDLYAKLSFGTDSNEKELVSQTNNIDSLTLIDFRCKIQNSMLFSGKTSEEYGSIFFLIEVPSVYENNSKLIGTDEDLKTYVRTSFEDGIRSLLFSCR